VIPLVGLWVFSVLMDGILPIDRWQARLGVTGGGLAGPALRWAYLLAVTAIGGGLYLSLRFGPRIVRRKWLEFEQRKVLEAEQNTTLPREAQSV
jgi:hypothetical protein